MGTIGLVSIGSLSIANVGSPFDCVGCTSTKSSPVRVGTFNHMHLVEIFPTLIMKKRYLPLDVKQSIISQSTVSLLVISYWPVK